MPKDAEVLSVQIQHGAVCIWARIDTQKLDVPRAITIRGTGHNCHEQDGKFIGTVQINEGALVFHVFDGGEL